VDTLDDMGVSKLSAKVFLKVNYSFNVKRNVFNLVADCTRSPFPKSSPF